MALMKGWQRKWYEASTLATEAISLAREGSLALQISVGQILFFSAQAALTTPAEILPLFEPVLTDLREQNAKIKLLTALAIAARVAYLASRKSLAKKYVQELLDVISETGIAQPAAAEIVNSGVLLALCTTMAADGPLAHAIQVLLEDRSTNPERSIQVTAEPISLRVLTLGASSVLRDGHRISTSEWRSSTAREVFFYLLFEGPTHREKLGAEFWPEATAEQVRSNFHTAIRRARGALGDKVLTFADEVYSINSEVSVWCDAVEFENLVTQARVLRPRDARTEDLLTRAIKLYHGEFLPESHHGWACPHRDKFHELYIEALLGLAACGRSRSDSKSALRSLKRALDLEPYREDIHRFVMQLYADRGTKRRVLDHYRTLCELLKADLNTEPSHETKELFQRLMG